MRPPTITDIAAHCGVAKSTVSKVLGLRSRHYEVSDELRERIRAAAVELGYVPDRQRQHWHGTRTQAVGLLSGQAAVNTSGIFAHIPHTVAAVLQEAGYLLLSLPVLEGVGNWERIVGDIRLDGCLIVAPCPAHLPAYLRQAGMPAVIINEADADGIISVQPDDAGGTRLAIEHLHALGHRRIAYLGEEPAGNHTSQQVRSAAYHAAMRDHGLAAQELTTLAAVHVALSERQARPTALLAYSDKVAFQVIAVLRELGLDLPRDLSVVMFNNTQAAELVSPPMTVVDVPMRAMAATAARSLLELIAGRQPGSTVVPEALIVRASTAAPAGS